MAFNLTVLSNLLGTPLEPDFTGVDLMIEDVSEQLYRIDRTMFHVTGERECPPGAPGCGLAGSATSLPTTPNFGARRSRHRRATGAPRSGIAYGGRADIGHDAANKVVPFPSQKD